MDSEETVKPDCYKCVHRENLVGSAHVQCVHPDRLSNATLQITANYHGIKNGWFLWPFDFDPTWLLKCNGFTKKERP